MHIIVTHASPDWDAITSVWLLKRFLPGWENAQIEFVPAGERSLRVAKKQQEADSQEVVLVGQDKIIHVDTGLTPLDHHQTADIRVCAASRTWDFVRRENPDFSEVLSQKEKDKERAIDKIIDYMVELDHFQEVFWENAPAIYHEFGPFGTLQGLKMKNPNQDNYYVNWGMEYLDAQLHNIQNRLWAEKEISEKGVIFKTRFGKALGIDTLNDSVIKLAQKMGYVLVIRRDPRKGYVRIKTLPQPAEQYKEKVGKATQIDLTPAYNQLSKMDPDATWFLHVSKKMLLNGSPKNPKMRPTKLNLQEMISVLEKV